MTISTKFLVKKFTKCFEFIIVWFSKYYYSHTCILVYKVRRWFLNSPIISILFWGFNTLIIKVFLLWIYSQRENIHKNQNENKFSFLQWYFFHKRSVFNRSKNDHFWLLAPIGRSRRKSSLLDFFAKRRVGRDGDGSEDKYFDNQNILFLYTLMYTIFVYKRGITLTIKVFYSQIFPLLSQDRAAIFWLSNDLIIKGYFNDRSVNDWWVSFWPTGQMTDQSIYTNLVYFNVYKFSVQSSITLIIKLFPSPTKTANLY